MVNIFLAEDHEVVRKGIREMLQAHPDWEICGETGNGRDAVKLTIQLNPHIALMDLYMPEMNGIEATRQIKKACPQVEILIYSAYKNEELIRRALEAGAHTYIIKTDTGQRLVEAVDTLSRHKPYLTKACEELLRSESEMSDQPLTGREREVIQLLAEGRANKEIAVMLCISVKTVETHRAALKRKLGISSLAQLVRYAIRNHLVKP